MNRAEPDREGTSFRSVVLGTVVGLLTLAGALFVAWVFASISTRRGSWLPWPPICFVIALYGSSVCARLCPEALGNAAFLGSLWSSLLLLHFFASRGGLVYLGQVLLFGLLHASVHLVIYNAIHTESGQSGRTEETHEPD